MRYEEPDGWEDYKSQAAALAVVGAAFAVAALAVIALVWLVTMVFGEAAGLLAAVGALWFLLRAARRVVYE